MNLRNLTVYAALEGSFGLEEIREALPAGTPVRAVALAEAATAGNEVQHGADQGRIGAAATGADVGQRVLGGMAQRFKPRKVEEAAIAFDGVDKAEDGIEPRAVVGLGFPGDDLAAQGLQHFTALGHEIGNQVVHRRIGPALTLESALWGEGVNAALSLSRVQRGA